MSKALRGRLLIVVTALLWGLAGICVKSISFSPMTIIAFRSVLSLLLLFIFKRSFRLRLTRRNLMAAGFTTATGLLYVTAIKLTTAGTAIVLQYIAPILVLLFSVLFQHRKLSVAEVLITVSVFAGCVLSFADTLDFTHLLGNLLALLSGLTFAGQIIVMNGGGCEPEDGMILSNLMSLVLCLPFVFFDRELSLDFQNILWILILGLFQYGTANLLFTKAIRYIDKVEASLILTIEPIFNPIPVAIFYGEKMGVLAILGSATVILSVTLYTLLPTIREHLDRSAKLK